MGMSVNSVFKIRPAGRHILTIGRDLIQDNYAAIVELVKNAYDADANNVEIEFVGQKSGYKISVVDTGHGMTRDIVTNQWMVPSTKDKLDRKISPEGRTMQGRKGVGRYAASILGQDLLLETVSTCGQKTTLYIEWAKFESAKYLEDVEILIESKKSSLPSSTRLTMFQSSKFEEEWDDKKLQKLKYELKKLKPPVEGNIVVEQENFEIRLTFKNFDHIEDCTEVIAPYPIIELYDYRIWGEIKQSGEVKLQYDQQNARNSTIETISYKIESNTECGDLIFDVRVFDREKDAITSLIKRGFKDENGNYVGKIEARNLLDEHNGVGVYRNGFRIRPLGDADFDWLRLNEKRVQNPSLKIGSNQVIGFVSIQAEEFSGLEEKSARDGLKENKSFGKLKYLTSLVIGELETRRFEYRKKSGLGRAGLKIEQQIEKLFSYDELKIKLKRKLHKEKVPQKTIDEILRDIEDDASNKNKSAEEIRQAVAIYQGQATLGKIINFVLHEGRRPLNYFKNQIPRIKRKSRGLIEKNKVEELFSMIDGVSENAENFVSLFSRLDPLASGRRPNRKTFLLENEVKKATQLFQSTNVLFEINLDKIEIFGWPQDIITVFSNLIENSIFWINEKKSVEKIIKINSYQKSDYFWIDYQDTGPGIEPNLIERDVIFEPDFSTKREGGTGLGLAIAGEAASRLGMELKVLESENGAYFRIEKKD